MASLARPHAQRPALPGPHPAPHAPGMPADTSLNPGSTASATPSRLDMARTMSGKYEGSRNCRVEGGRGWLLGAHPSRRTCSPLPPPPGSHLVAEGHAEEHARQRLEAEAGGGQLQQRQLRAQVAGQDVAAWGRGRGVQGLPSGQADAQPKVPPSSQPLPTADASPPRRTAAVTAGAARRRRVLQQHIVELALQVDGQLPSVSLRLEQVQGGQVIHLGKGGGGGAGQTVCAKAAGRACR